MIALTNGGSQVLKLEGAVLIAFFGTVVVVISNMLTANWGSAAAIILYFSLPRLYERMNTMPLGLRGLALTSTLVGFPVVRYNVGNVLGRTLCQWYKPQTAGLAAWLQKPSSKIQGIPMVDVWFVYNQYPGCDHFIYFSLDNAGSQLPTLKVHGVWGSWRAFFKPPTGPASWIEVFSFGLVTLSFAFLCICCLTGN